MSRGTLVSITIGAILLTACSPGGASTTAIEASVPPTAETFAAQTEPATPIVDTTAANNCAQSDAAGDVDVRLKPH